MKNNQTERDPHKVRTLYAEAVKELAVLRRSAIVNQLYGGRKLAVEELGAVRMRGDT